MMPRHIIIDIIITINYNKLLYNNHRENIVKTIVAFS